MNHSHTPDVDFGAHAEDLEQGAKLWSEVTAAIAGELPVPPGAAVADIGCGTGEMTLQLARRVKAAERVKAGGRVYAVDREAVLLDRVRERAHEAGLGGQVIAVQAELEQLPAALPEPVQLVWAGRVVHHAGDQAVAIRALAAALGAGGTLAIAEGGLPMRCLPWDVGVGRPGIEGRLVAAHEAWFGAMRADLPGSVRDPRGWPAMLRAAGLVDVTARGWLLHRPAPLTAAERKAVVDRTAHWVERAEPWLAADDQQAWARLLDSADPAWLGHRDDLQVLAVETVHVGTRPTHPTRPTHST